MDMRFDSLTIDILYGVLKKFYDIIEKQYVVHIDDLITDCSLCMETDLNIVPGHNRDCIIKLLNIFCNNLKTKLLDRSELINLLEKCKFIISRDYLVYDIDFLYDCKICGTNGYGKHIENCVIRNVLIIYNRIVFFHHTIKI